MTIKEVSEITNISVRNLQYYSDEGIVVPERDKNGYRNYSDLDVQRLQQVKIFKSLGMRLKEIKEIMNADDYDMKSVFRKQIVMLEEKKKEIILSITLARTAIIGGIDFIDPIMVDNMNNIKFIQNFSDGMGVDKTLARLNSLDDETSEEMLSRIRGVFKRFGVLRDDDPESKEVQANVDDLTKCISDYMTECPPGYILIFQLILQGNGSAAELADQTGGEGTAKLAAAAMNSWIRKKIRITIEQAAEQMGPLIGRPLTDPYVKKAYEELTAAIKGFFGEGVNNNMVHWCINQFADNMLKQLDDSVDGKATIRYVKEVFNYYGGTDNDQ